MDIALIRVEELRALAVQAEERGQSDLLMVCAQALEAIFKEINRGEHQRGQACSSAAAARVGQGVVGDEEVAWTRPASVSKSSAIGSSTGAMI